MPIDTTESRGRKQAAFVTGHPETSESIHVSMLYVFDDSKRLAASVNEREERIEDLVGFKLDRTRTAKRARPDGSPSCPRSIIFY